MRNKKLMIAGALAIGGILLTAATTAWGTYKATKVIEEKKPETKKEAVKLVWKYYIPAGVAIGVTIISDVCFYKIGMKELAALTASVTYLTSNRDKLEKKLKEVVGEEKYNEIKKEIKSELIAEKAKETKKTENTTAHKRFPAEETGYGDQLFLDGWSGRFFRSSIEEVIKGINSFNDMYNTELPWPTDSGDKITCCPTAWNNFYSFMHIAQTHQGDEFGYPANEDYIKPGTILIDPNKNITRCTEDEVLTGYHDIGEDIYVIEPSVYPMLCWKEL